MDIKDAKKADTVSNIIFDNKASQQKFLELAIKSPKHASLVLPMISPICLCDTNPVAISIADLLSFYHFTTSMSNADHSFIPLPP